MISASSFWKVLSEHEVDFATGVPDSLLKEFCLYLERNLPASKHVIAANEGSALAIAAGYQIATGKLPLIYMQNSGLGNAVNPLVSLADPAVYSVPILLVVGWRGEPGVHDEPQHVKQGEITPGLLECMDIPYEVLSPDSKDWDSLVGGLLQRAMVRKGPVALLVKKGVFATEMERNIPDQGTDLVLTREIAIQKVASAVDKETIVVASTGHISRELYEYRNIPGGSAHKDFLTVGCMGHASQIALGMCLAYPNRKVLCLDGDGSALMHLGGMATIGARKPRNYVHVVLNNGVHDSVGAQPTVGFQISFTKLAKAAGYPVVKGPILREEEFSLIADGELLNTDGPVFLEIRVMPGARDDLGRPNESPVENKQNLIQQIRTENFTDVR